MRNHEQSMSKLFIFFELLKNAIVRPKTILELSEERTEVKRDENFRKHKYSFNIDSIDQFFEDKFPNIDQKDFENELKELDSYVNNFLKNLETKKYPSKEKPYPVDYSINSDSRRFLYILCRIMRPKNIIETGVAYGLSSIYILKALNKNNFGTLHSIDSVFRPWQEKKMIGSIIPDELKKRWRFNFGSSNEKLEQVFNDVDDVQIFIHDSLHTYKNMMFEFNCAEKNLGKDGIIISDDVLDNDAFFDFTNQKRLENYLVKVKHDLGLGIIIKNHI